MVLVCQWGQNHRVLRFSIIRRGTVRARREELLLDFLDHNIGIYANDVAEVTLLLRSDINAQLTGDDRDDGFRLAILLDRFDDLAD